MDSVLAFVIGVAIIVVGLAVSIGLHEIGHLVPAKLFGVKVTQYMIGFGPTVWSKRKGETEYGVKAIPLGGYIAMIGMFPPAKGEAATAGSTSFFRGLVQDARDSSAESITPGDEDRAFYRLPVWKRIVVMFGGPFMNLVLAIVLFGVLLMGFGVAQASTTIGSVSECALPATSERQTCESGDPAAPGAEAGLQPGDTIVVVAGEPIDSWNESTAIIRDHPDEPIDMVVLRDGEEVTLEVTPLLSERYVTDERGQVVTDASGDPVTVQAGFVGIGPATETVRQPVTAVLPMVGENVQAVAGIIVNLPQRIVDVAEAAFGPEERDPNGPISVVGVGRVAGEIASLDEVPLASKAAGLVGILASLNIALFVFNLIPLLPLDGGHIAGALWEAIRRGWAKLRRRPDPGPVDLAKLMPLTFAVVVILGGMSALLIYADIVKPVSLL
ncbi:membrane-associated protease RseP (regulator of RpoE activity) [Agromyces flavus]|uniref:Membrane-associated protease RseP (Regulator of RpoE activity) n=1 Tax=Agromyces flavus TaxID=589382 RepID=A0ABT1KN82_9MICO|nr:site-2 protease family protein [Agromyces flavus]MCP2368359.1 membrane-associated protease RseP (regulator of RpoE activity) [Agromyces flavus]GGI47821.1 peptidase [Agromyces flavus]